MHSRIGAVADYVAEHARVGNLYVNRNQIGAVPGVQPFGGEGLSGTGPKAGGPNYLARFATERVRTTDITATGGNIGLLDQGYARSRLRSRLASAHPPKRPLRPCRQRSMLGYPFLFEATAADPCLRTRKSPANHRVRRE